MKHRENEMLKYREQRIKEKKYKDYRIMALKIKEYRNEGPLIPTTFKMQKDPCSVRKILNLDIEIFWNSYAFTHKFFVLFFERP